MYSYSRTYIAEFKKTTVLLKPSARKKYHLRIDELVECVVGEAVGAVLQPVNEQRSLGECERVLRAPVGTQAARVGVERREREPVCGARLERRSTGQREPLTYR